VFDPVGRGTAGRATRARRARRQPARIVRYQSSHGDVDARSPRAAAVVEGVYRLNLSPRCCLETWSRIAEWDAQGGSRCGPPRRCPSSTSGELAGALGITGDRRPP